MAEASYIPRHKREADAYSFESFRGMGIARVQELAGNIWTDYNEHDPGVTILEQICYALTDIVYRAEFPVPDFLVDNKGEINWERQGLLPARPTTELDYRKVILDAVPEIENVRIEAVPNQDGTPTGLYKFLLRPRAETNDSGVQAPVSAQTSSGSGPEYRQIVEKVVSVFFRLRNLCEDIDSIVVESAVDFKLNAEVEIQEGRDPAFILARIYQVCGIWLAGGIEFISYERALSHGTSPEEIFRGPLVRSGMIASSTSQSRKGFPPSDIYSLIKAIPGVESVKTFPNEIDGQNASDSVLRLYWPQNDDEIGVKIFCNRRAHKVSLHDLMMRFEELKFAHHSMRSDRCDSIVSRPQGKVRDLRDYISAQYHFPLIYGVGPRGVPESATPREKALVRQLKGYLLFFDQNMADMLATMDNLRQLYSTEIDKHKTYFSQLLSEDSFPGFEQVCDPDGVIRLQQLLDRQEYTDRTTRLLDYLLALYGESFRDEPLVQSGQNQSMEEMDAILDDRIAYLKKVASITRDRAAATDYLQPPGDQANRSGIEAKLSHLLGFEKHYISTEEGVRVIEYILLRPVNWKERRGPTLQFRICVLFPGWMHRCKDPNFRRYAAETVDSCCPAHIYADIHWLTRDQMVRFDDLYRQWWLSHREQTKADELLEFLTGFDKKEQSI
jgi:hypothetical protein